MLPVFFIADSLLVSVNSNLHLMSLPAAPTDVQQKICSNVSYIGMKTAKTKKEAKLHYVDIERWKKFRHIASMQIFISYVCIKK